MPGTLRKHLLKFDQQATSGIAGTADSVGYVLAELEGHIHNWERWFGLAGTPDAELHRADAIGAGINAFQMDAGNNTWGAWLQILGSSDTAKTFDLHRLMITAVERNGAIHFVQLGWGTSGAAALTAGNYTELVYKPASVNAEAIPLNLIMHRRPAATKGWARVLVPGQDTGTMNFYIGLHYYDG